MVSKEEAREKRFFLLDKVKSQLNAKSIKYNCHDADVSELEGVFARGDRKLNDVILQAYQSGCIYDAWTEYFHYDKWLEAFADHNIDMDFYLKEAVVTPNCRAKCAGCGAAKFGCGVCVES